MSEPQVAYIILLRDTPLPGQFDERGDQIRDISVAFDDLDGRLLAPADVPPYLLRKMSDLTQAMNGRPKAAFLFATPIDPQEAPAYMEEVVRQIMNLETEWTRDAFAGYRIPDVDVPGPQVEEA